MAVMDKNEERSDKNENSKEQAPTEDGSLESFITKHYELQKVMHAIVKVWSNVTS